MKPRVACIGTVWRTNSHVDVFISHFLDGCVIAQPAGGPDETYVPRIEIASLYLDQFPPNDLGREKAGVHDVPIFATVAGALTLGTGQLAVDGVLIMAEHGEYPWNEKEQHLYPRRRLFEEVVAVFAGSGRVVPVFNDKHLSHSWEDARWMYETARQMGIPFMAGSSVPNTWRQPPLELPRETPLQAALAVGYGGLESYGFHTLEGLQCMVERRRGGETGVRSVQLLSGPSVWEAGDAGRWSWELLAAALSRAGNTAEGDVRDNVREPYAFLIEYNDGFQAGALMLNGHVSDYLFAARLADRPEPVATWFWNQKCWPYGHAARLNQDIEELFLKGRSPYPVERTVLTTGMLAAGMDSRFAGGRRIATPELSIHYPL